MTNNDSEVRIIKLDSTYKRSILVVAIVSIFIDDISSECSNVRTSYYDVFGSLVGILELGSGCQKGEGAYEVAKPDGRRVRAADSRTGIRSCATIAVDVVKIINSFLDGVCTR